MRKFLLSLAAWAAKILPNSFKQGLYKIKPLAAFIRRGLNRAAPTGVVQVKVAGGDLAGFSILLDMQVDKDYWLGVRSSRPARSSTMWAPISVTYRSCWQKPPGRPVKSMPSRPCLKTPSVGAGISN